MSKVKAGPINGDRLKSFIERIEKLEEERAAIGGDVKDVYSEAKGVGYDVATMRKIVALRRKDAADRAEADTLLDVYKHALGMETSEPVTIVAPPVSEEELEERAARIVTEVDRCMDLVEGAKLPKIAAIQALLGCSQGKAHKLRCFVAERISRETVKVRENENPPARSAEEEEAAWEEFRREDDADASDCEARDIQESCGDDQSDRQASAADEPSRCEDRETISVSAPPHDTHPETHHGAVPEETNHPLQDAPPAIDNEGGSHEPGLTNGPEVARAAPPASLDTRGEAPNPPPMSDETALANLHAAGSIHASEA